jgi:hypothetical protein
VPEIGWTVDGQELVPTWPSRDDPLEARYWQISDRYSVGSYRQFTETVSHVNITSVRVEDGGAYQCTAFNLLGRLSHSARLNIYGKRFLSHFSLHTHTLPIPIGSVTVSLGASYGHHLGPYYAYT